MAKLIYEAKNSLLILSLLSQELVKEDTENLIVSLREARIDNHASQTELLCHLHARMCKYLPQSSSALLTCFRTRQYIVAY